MVSLLRRVLVPGHDRYTLNRHAVTGGVYAHHEYVTSDGSGSCILFGVCGPLRPTVERRWPLDVVYGERLVAWASRQEWEELRRIEGEATTRAL